MPSRRRFLELGLWSSAALALGPMFTRRAHAATAHAPRYVVFVVLRGGFDAIYTTDPRTTREVDSGVDVPYEPSAIVERGARRFGPHIACMTEHEAQLSILNGVRTNTAAHDIGTMQLVRLKTNTVHRTPSFLELVGQTRQGQLLGAVTLGCDETHYSSGWLGTARFDAGELPPQRDLFDRILEQTPEEQRLIAESLRAQRKSLAGVSAGDRRWLVEQLESGAQLWEHAAAWPKFEAEGWHADNELPRRLQRATWLFEHDIARCALVSATRIWDTHEKNAPRQTDASGYTMPMIARFLAQLRTRSNAHGSLADQTLVIVGTEMGRLPFLNHRQGKDHLPQIPFMMFWPGLRAQTFGVTGRQMETHDISLETGGAGLHPLMLDDVGVTLLRRFGLDPALHGYVGSSLDFLWA